MRCPFCNADETKVIDSRSKRDGLVIRRRRVCEDCEGRFTTYEEIGDLLPMVIKKDHSREVFNRQKIIRGIIQACQKRPISAETIEAIAIDIERHLMQSSEKEIESRRIGEEVMHRLQQLDQVAYIRFVSVYRDFRNIEEFLHELNSLLHKKNETKPDIRTDGVGKLEPHHEPLVLAKVESGMKA